MVTLFALAALVVACALPWWYASRFGLAPGMLAYLAKAPLIGSTLGMLVAMSVALVWPETQGDLLLALPFGAIAGYPALSLPLFAWVLVHRRRQVRHLRRLIRHATALPGWSYDRDNEVDRRVETALERLDGYLPVKFVPCARQADPLRDQVDGAYEDWAEVVDEDPGYPAYVIVPARAPLRRSRSGSAGELLEPWNPYAAVLIAPSLLRQDAEFAVIPASDGLFCQRVQSALARAVARPSRTG